MYGGSEKRKLKSSGTGMRRKKFNNMFDDRVDIATMEDAKKVIKWNCPYTNKKVIYNLAIFRIF